MGEVTGSSMKVRRNVYDLLFFFFFKKKLVNLQYVECYNHVTSAQVSRSVHAGWMLILCIILIYRT